MKNALAAVRSMRPTPTDRIIAITLRPEVLKINTTTKVMIAIPEVARINAVGSHSVASHGAVKREPKKLAATKRPKSPASMAPPWNGKSDNRCHADERGVRAPKVLPTIIIPIPDMIADHITGFR